MTTNDANEVTREILKAHVGRLMRKLDTAGFKLAVCLGPTRDGTKMRICVWSDNQRKWSKPQTRYLGQLDEIYQIQLGPGQQRAVMHAWQDIKAHEHFVAGVHVGKPWLNKSADPRTTGSGVTKLPARTSVLTKDGSAVKKSKVQELNQALSGWMFGGRK